jgi:hypothetical protein
VDSRGDLLLFAVAAHRQLTWGSFSRMVDAIFVPDERVANDVGHVRTEVASLGDVLGHWDVITDDRGTRICIAPPALAILPRPGRPSAVLCGSRSSDTGPVLARACRMSGVEMTITKQQHLNPYAASRVEVVSDSQDNIAAVAAGIGIECRPSPAAWALAQASGSIDEYLKGLSWTTEEDLNWTRRDFDPVGLRFSPVPLDSNHPPFGLSNYTIPAGWARQDRLWRDNENARIDRSWGRYAVLESLGRQVLRFDHQAGLVAVPRQVPLPKIPARSLALCSGRPPTLKAGVGLGYHVYSGIPISVFEALAKKMGQHGARSEEGAGLP